MTVPPLRGHQSKRVGPTARFPSALIPPSPDPPPAP